MLESFFELLRAGLWEKPADAALFHPATTDWQRIFQLAQQQAVVGVAFDGMETLPRELRPPYALYVRWSARVAVIETTNEYLNDVAIDLLFRFSEKGLQPVMLKGQGIAAIYPTPTHRQCGDIDIYVGPKQYARAKQLMEEWGGIAGKEESIKHQDFKYDTAHVEIHRIAATLHHPVANRRMNAFVGKWMPYATWGLPAPTFNAVYLFVHAFNHFLGSGIGLRQLCDWARLLKMTADEIDREEVTAQLTAMKLLKAAGDFAYIATHYLGLEPEYIPFPVKEKKEDGEKLLADILMTGNFGQYDPRIKPRPNGYWAGKWQTFTRAVGRCNELRRYAPTEAFWYPLFLIRNASTEQWNRLNKRMKR